MSRSAFAAAISIAVATLLPADGARAQWYSSVSQPPPPLYPYAVPSDRPYAVEVAPGTYVIKRPGGALAEPVQRERRASVKSGAARDRRHSKADPALIEELRKRGKVKHTVVNIAKIVHEKPVVIETKRYVDDPPRVVERYRVVEDKRPGYHSEPVMVEDRAGVSKKTTGKRIAKHNVKNNDKQADKPASKHDGNEKRVIQADAEITILGPDRMSIRLFRKGDSRKANVSAD